MDFYKSPLFRCWRRVWLINHFICFLRIRVKQQWCHKSTIPELLSLLLLLIFFKDRHWCSSSIWQTPAGSALHVQIQCSAFSECPFCRFAMKIEQVGYVMCCCNRRKEVVTKQFSQCIYDPICSISTISVLPATPHSVLSICLCPASSIPSCSVLSTLCAQQGLMLSWWLTPSLTWQFSPTVLVSAGIDLIFLLLADTVLWFWFSMRTLLVTHWCFSC